MTDPLLVSAFENGLGTVVDWMEVPGALFYNVVRGDVKNIREKLDTSHLGRLSCIAPAITFSSTLGLEDAQLPPIGEAFFYLAEYNNGSWSSFGTESAAKPRFVPPGQGNCP